MHFLFDDPTDPIEEGPVKIQFEVTENRKIKATYTVDFSKTDLNSHEAANVNKVIVGVLRVGLGIKLSKFK